MSPMQPTTQRPSPTADDLIFLLSIAIASDPAGFIAGHHRTQQPGDARRAKSSGGGGKGQVGASKLASWRRALTSLPARRREIVLALRRLASARQKWTNLSTTTAREGRSDFGRTDDGSSNGEVDALEEVERAASAVRSCAADYLDSANEYKSSLREFWHLGNDRDPSELSRVGSRLASQLLRQLGWDEGLSIAALEFLDKELYGDDDAATEKLRVWADAAARMVEIDKSYWEFVEREVYDETDLEEEAPEFLNGEPSTKLMSVSHFEESGRSGDEGAIDPPPCENSVVEENGLHERIVSGDSLEEAMETFVNGECRIKNENDGRRACDSHQQTRSLTSILLVGEEGCGKTHLLDSIQRRLSGCPVRVLRPNYPADLVGSTVGSSEDRLMALFSYASGVTSASSKNRGRKCLLVLDDIDRMLSLSDDANDASSDAGRTAQYFVGRRCKALFLTILDELRERRPCAEDGHLLLLCTARSRCGEVAGRFDRTFRRGQPDEEQRRRLIASCLSIRIADGSADVDEAGFEGVLSLVVRHSAGRSAYELSQCCREAILSCAQSASSDEKGKSSIFSRRLQRLDRMLQMKSPHSLRGGSLDGIVEMRVYTPDELQSKLRADVSGTVLLPLLGADAKRAHEALMNVVITPLCRSDEIRALLYGEGAADDAKPIRVGALLAGAPGVGKTSLAYHCASLAAKMSRVSLLDVSCTSLIHKEIGGSERAVQRLFAAVRAAAPCILLLDGIENVAPRRGNDDTSEGTMDRVLSTFLTEMDGVDTDGASGNVAVIGVTRDPNLIDPSLLRPGRLERTIALGPPDFDARREIVSRQIEDASIDFSSPGCFDPKSNDDVSRFVAMESAGMSAVEVIAICREASMECLRDLNFEATKKPALTHQHFKRAIKVMKGKSSGRAR